MRYRALAAAGAALLLAACTAAPPAGRPGTPAPARAPGSAFRAQTPQGVELRYDPARQAYAVPSAPGAFWLDGRFYRRGAAGWEASTALDGPWRACGAADLPEGLRSAR